MIKEVVLVTGAGQLSMAIARRVGFGKKSFLATKRKIMQMPSPKS